MLKPIINIEYYEYYTKEEAIEKTKNRVMMLQKDEVSCEVSIERSIYNNIITYCVTILIRDASIPGFDLPNPKIDFPKY